MISGSALSELDEQILSTFLLFNNSLQKTNFFRSNKAALSFRLDPSFLGSRDYPAVPFALIFVLGRDFRGFHVRFRDVARGTSALRGHRLLLVCC
jgi:glutamate dehydrogenase